MTWKWHVKKYRGKRVTNKTTCLCETKACERLERLWKRLRRWEGRMREALHSRWWFGNGFKHIFNFPIRIIVLRERCTLWSHNATFCFYYSENKGEYMRTSVISNQWIKPGGQSSITYCFSWIAEKHSLALLSLVSGHSGEENKNFNTQWSIIQPLKRIHLNQF